MARQLTDMQQRFLDCVFTTAEGDLTRAKRQAGYSDTTPLSVVTNSVADELNELTKKYLAASSAQAAYAMVKVLSGQVDLGVKDKMAAAKDILDRAGFVKTDKVEVSGTGAVFILPAKEDTTD